jgi:hypothetical protein
MRSTSFSLLPALTELLVAEGYARLPLKLGASALFCKRRHGLFLTLGVEVSRHFGHRFTGSFYLAPIFSWAYAPPIGFPARAYRRIGECLTPRQRRQVEPDAPRAQVDVWWQGFTPENARQFAELASIAEAKLWKDRRLHQAVKTCAAVGERLEMFGAVAQELRRPRLAADPLLAEVRQEEQVPRRWYLAAASVAKRRFPDCYQKHGIKMLAEEGWLLREWKP